MHQLGGPGQLFSHGLGVGGGSDKPTKEWVQMGHLWGLLIVSSQGVSIVAKIWWGGGGLIWALKALESLLVYTAQPHKMTEFYSMSILK